jgi:hypothetical protein
LIPETFNITREIDQELAETGSVQLRDLSLDGLPAKHPKKCRLFNEEGYQSLEGLSDVGVTLSQLAWQILRLSGHNVQNPDVTLLSFITLLDTGVHLDAKGAKQGVSFLWVPGSLVSNDQVLTTYGRSKEARELAQKRYQYSNGLIVIAQQGFGSKILEPGLDLGATWHKGERRAKSNICVADIHIGAPTTPTHTSPALPQHMSSALVDSNL